MTKDITDMVYPMLALGNVSIGRLDFKLGDTFDAKTISNVNFLKMAGTARVLRKPVPAAKVVKAPVDVVKTDMGAATQAESKEHMSTLEPSGEGEGTNDASKETTSAPARGRGASGSRSTGRVSRRRGG